MKIKMLTTSAGPKGIRHAGQIIEMPDKEAQELISTKNAELVKQSAGQKDETTDNPPQKETTDKRSGKKN